MRFNFLLPILAAAFGFGGALVHVGQAASNAALAANELKAIAPVLAPRRRAPLWLLDLSVFGGTATNHKRQRWNQRKLRKRDRRAAGAGLGRMAFA